MKPRAWLAFLALILALGFAAEAQAEVQTPAGLKPGDHFRIVFVTSTTCEGKSSDIATYDNFVTDRATAGGLATYAGQPVTWKAICSTAKVSIKSQLPDTSPALFLPSGQMVAASGKDYWSNDNRLVRPIDFDENGRGTGRYEFGQGLELADLKTGVWTGVEPTDPGSNVQQGFRLGDIVNEQTFPMFWVEGLTRRDGSLAVRAELRADASLFKYRLYGVSSELTVPAGRALGVAAAAPAPIQTPAGLKTGDQFRIVFVTSTARDAASSDIADYDAFVTKRAKAGGLDTYAGTPVTWSAIGSTAHVSAKSRLPDTSPPLFLPSGQQVAVSGKDFWTNDVAFVLPIDLNEYGRAIAGADTFVWVGASATGEPNLDGLGPYLLGNLGSEADSRNASMLWTGWTGSGAAKRGARKDGLNLNKGPLQRLYGFSLVLTVPASK